MNEGIGSRACAAMTDCSSDLSRIGERIASTAKEVAAVVQPIFSIYRRCRVEQHRDPRDARCNLLEQFHPFAGHRRLGSKDETGDVAAGGAKLATKPLSIGSATSAKTMGMVRVF
jgi:hypothetical protein